jgi:hypothetical protein
MRTVLILAALLLGAGAARAELVLVSVAWEPASLDIGSAKLVAKTKAKARLMNRGPKKVEGVLMRYSLTAQLDGQWVVPFTIEQKRVARIKPNQIIDVAIGPSPMLPLYLKKLKREGISTEALKLQVMLEPRPGEPQAVQVAETVLQVKKP